MQNTLIGRQLNIVSATLEGLQLPPVYKLFEDKMFAIQQI